MAWSALALLCWMVVRLVSGADLYDGSHIVALAQRIAQGDLLFVDEMNAQAVGSAFGAPFVWVWTHLFGQNFLVLAYRWFYLLVAAGVGLFSYRALRAGGIRPLIAFTALAWALVITSYHVWGISYNTVPTLAMVLATCCGYAAVRGPRERAARWLVPVGVALPCGAISLQSLAPSMVVTAMVLLVLTWRRGVWLPLLVSLAVTSAVILSYFLGVIGWSAIKATIDYTVDYQAPRSTPGERLSFTTVSWLYELIRPVRLPAVLVALVTVVPVVPRAWRARAAVWFPVVLGLTSLLALQVDGINWMRYGGSIQLYTVWCLLPLALWWTWRHDRALAPLLLIAAPTVVLGLPMVAATTYAGPWYGEFPPASVAMSIAVSVAVLRFVAAQGLGAKVRAGSLRLAVIASVGVLLITQLATNFYGNGAFVSLVPAPSPGPYAGLLSGGRELWHLREVDQTVRQWVKPGQSLMVYGAVTGAFLITGARADTNIVWLEDFADIGQVSVDWYRRTDRLPDVILVSTDAVQGDGFEAFARRDPVLSYLLPHYRRAAGLETFAPGQYRSQAGLIVLVKQ